MKRFTIVKAKSKLLVAIMLSFISFKIYNSTFRINL
jgi:hypothetical protein